MLGVVLAYGVSTDWPGKTALGWGVVAGVIVWTAVQAWWFTAAVPRSDLLHGVSTSADAPFVVC